MPVWASSLRPTACGHKLGHRYQVQSLGTCLSVISASRCSLCWSGCFHEVMGLWGNWSSSSAYRSSSVYVLEGLRVHVWIGKQAADRRCLQE